jgi:hypothetical protein
MTRLSPGALLLVLVTACKPPTSGPTIVAASTPSPGPAAAPPPGDQPSALETERTRATERALGMIGRNDPALGARIAAAELADPLHGLPARIRELLNSLAGEGLDPSQRSLLIRQTFDEDAQLRSAFDAACRPKGWSGLALSSMAEGQRVPAIAEGCKDHPAAQPSERPVSIALAIPLSIGIEGVLRAQHAPAMELRLARALMYMQ